MELLDAIWMVSIALALTSIFVMSILIVRRVYTDAAALQHDKRRAELEQQFFQALDGAYAFDLASLSEADKMILAEIAYDLSTSVKGEILRDFEDLLTRLGVVQTLIGVLSSPDPNQRIMAINGLSMFHAREAFDAVWQLLSDPNLNVRTLAARVIVDAPFRFDAQAFTETLELGTVVRSREVRPIVVKLAERDPHGVLRAIAATDNSERRVFLIYGLGRSGSYEMVDDIVDFTFSENVNERSESLRALSALQHPAAAAAVRIALRDPAWEVRAQAAQAVSDIGLPGVQSILEKMLSDDNWWVRYRAAESLWQLGGSARNRLMVHAHDEGRVGEVVQLIIAEQNGVAA